MDEAITVEVPIHVVGEAAGRQGPERRARRSSCEPSRSRACRRLIPERIDVDVSALRIHDVADRRRPHSCPRASASDDAQHAARRHRGPADGRGRSWLPSARAGRPSPRSSPSGSPRRRTRPRARTPRRRARPRSRAGRIRRPRRRLPMVADVASSPRVIVGLGNPGRGVPRHAAQPRPSGRRRSWRCAWTRASGSAVPPTWPRPPGAGGRCTSPSWSAFMNVSGPPLARLLRLPRRDPGPAGRRVRRPGPAVRDGAGAPAGPHGGHHGMESVLGTLGTQEVRRVKIGVGRPATPRTRWWTGCSRPFSRRGAGGAARA